MQGTVKFINIIDTKLITKQMSRCAQPKVLKTYSTKPKGFSCIIKQTIVGKKQDQNRREISKVNIKWKTFGFFIYWSLKIPVVQLMKICVYF